MSLSKAALNMAEALRPVLVKLIPQKMLSAVKAKVIEKGAKDLEKTEITIRDWDRVCAWSLKF